jgi:colicin import membrane protein
MSEVAAPPVETSGPDFAGLWVRFGVPLVLTVLIHAVAILTFTQGWSTEPSGLRETPRAIEARLLTLEAQAPEPAARTEAPRTPEPAPERSDAPQRTTPPRSDPDTRPAPEPAPTPAPRAEGAEAPPEPAPQPAASDRTSDFEDDAWRDAVGSSFDAALDAEAERLAAQEAQAATGSFVGAIVARIEQHWSRPPSARNDMEAELRIALVPTGELVSVDVVRSSGNAAFDRSAEVAVRQAAPFRVPDDPTLFESRFRNLTILFKPEDLRN